MLFDVCGIFLSIFILSILFSVLGELIYSFSIPNSAEHPLSFKIGLGYFLGLSSFVMVFKILSSITGTARMPLGIAFTLLLLPMLKVGNLPLRKYIKTVDKKLLYWSIAVVLMSFIVPLVYYGSPPFGVSSVLGTLHPHRYGNIARYISDYNRIPVLSQNYAQAILASIPGIIGLNRVLFSMYIWLVFSIIALFTVSYGFLKFFISSKPKAAIGSFVVMFGQTALSLIHINIVDSGNPFIMNGYTDSILSIGTLFAFVVCFNSLSLNKGNIFRKSIILIVIGSVWNISAPQNIAICFLIIALAACLSFIRKTQDWRNYIVALLIFVSAVLIGSRQGGMVVSRSEKLPFIGVLKRYPVSAADILPVMPISREILGTGMHGFIRCYSKENKKVLLMLEKKLFHGMKIPKRVLSLIWKLEVSFWSALRSIFFPLLGLLLLGFVLVFSNIGNFLKRDEYVQYNTSLSLRKFFFIASTSLAVGFTIVFFLRIGYKMELLRFLIPGYCFGLIALIISADIYSKIIDSRIFTYVFWGFVLLFTTIGPIGHFLRLIRVYFDYSFLKYLSALTIKTSNIPWF